MAARQAYSNTAAGPVSTTSATFADLASLTFTPDATSDYYFLWSFQQSNNTQTADGIKFSFSDLGGYRKIIDFKDKTSDNGLYDRDAALNFFPVGSGVPNVFTADTSVDVLIARWQQDSLILILTGDSKLALMTRLLVTLHLAL